MMRVDTVLYEGEATPNDVMLYVPADPYPVEAASQETTVMMWATEVEAQIGADATDLVVTRTAASGAGQATGVYPEEGKVRSGVYYGPNGYEFAGNVELPVEGDVRKDVKYGAYGSEYTGTLEPGSGSAKKRIRWVMQ